MQCSAIEYARNVLKIDNANSTEFSDKLNEEEQVSAVLIISSLSQIVIDMPEHDITSMGMGATMRLGRRSTVFITDNSKLSKCFFFPASIFHSCFTLFSRKAVWFRRGRRASQASL